MNFQQELHFNEQKFEMQKLPCYLLVKQPRSAVSRGNFNLKRAVNLKVRRCSTQKVIAEGICISLGKSR